jgi:hypothetical protein
LRCRVARIALVVVAVGLAVGGCKNSTQLFEDNNEGGWFSKPMDAFAKPSWARATSEDQQNVILNPRGPVDANELVGTDGRCSEPVVAAAAPALTRARQCPKRPRLQSIRMPRSASRRAALWSWAASRSA